LERTWGGADIFVANAGFAYYERIEEPDWARLEAIFRLNTLSVLYSLEKMAHLAGDRDFHFVITASGTSFLAMPGYALYSATKAALERFVDAYRFEMGPNARISVVYPIATRTAFFEAAGRDVPLPWPIQDPSTVAQAIIRGVEKDQERIYPSRLFRMTLLLDKVCPLVGRVYQDRAARRLRDWLARKKQAGS
jgi:short-subunit dehydrogenase